MLSDALSSLSATCPQASQWKTRSESVRSSLTQPHLEHALDVAANLGTTKVSRSGFPEQEKLMPNGWVRTRAVSGPDVTRGSAADNGAARELTDRDNASNTVRRIADNLAAPHLTAKPLLPNDKAVRCHSAPCFGDPVRSA